MFVANTVVVVVGGGGCVVVVAAAVAVVVVVVVVGVFSLVLCIAVVTYCWFYIFQSVVNKSHVLFIQVLV